MLYNKYFEIHLKDNLFLRQFKNSSIMQWHKDLEDRIIYSLLPTNWKFQLDNEMPLNITKEQIKIQKNVYHRLIPSNDTQDLFLYVIKHI
jgi:hypothetical protein